MSQRQRFVVKHPRIPVKEFLWSVLCNRCRRDRPKFLEDRKRPSHHLATMPVYFGTPPRRDGEISTTLSSCGLSLVKAAPSRDRSISSLGTSRVFSSLSLVSRLGFSYSGVVLVFEFIGGKGKPLCLCPVALVTISYSIKRRVLCTSHRQLKR
jgi:hypothetical protein